MKQICIRIVIGVLAFTLGVTAHKLATKFQLHSMRSAVAPTLSTDEKWHRLYEAALMSGLADVREEVVDRLLCSNPEGVPDAWLTERDGQSWCQNSDRRIHELRIIESSEYGSFSKRITTSHRLWAMRNLDFIRSISTAKSARAYALSHKWPPDR